MNLFIYINVTNIQIFHLKYTLTQPLINVKFTLKPQLIVNQLENKKKPAEQPCRFFKNFEKF